VRETSDLCAGPFGAFYDFYIERPRLSRVIGRLLWGIDTAPLYRSIATLGTLPDGATILDAPCGGGLALRGLRPGQQVRYVAADLSQAMLDRCQRRAAARALAIEPLLADMRELPLPDGIADVCLSYSGLHMVGDPDVAIAEIGRCLKPGGRLLGSTFVAQGSRRQKLLFDHGVRTGRNGALGTAGELQGWLAAAGIEELTVSPEQGFALFAGRKAVAGPQTSC
jgi:SAM-dependent methyltransferase